MKKDAFVNATMAIMAMQTLQMYFGNAGYLVTSSINTKIGKCELTVYFTTNKYPTIPTGYNYSTRVVESHEFFSNFEMKVVRNRTMTLTFEF